MKKTFSSIDKSEFRGVVRHIDKLGRICVPKEFRISLKLNHNDMLKLFIYADGVLLRLENETSDGVWDAIHPIDKLGRMSIPQAMRRKLGINVLDNIEIFLLKNGLFIRKAKS